jgi:uncharacterized membrane protein
MVLFSVISILIWQFRGFGKGDAPVYGGLILGAQVVMSAFFVYIPIIELLNIFTSSKEIARASKSSSRMTGDNSGGPASRISSYLTRMECQIYS